MKEDDYKHLDRVATGIFIIIVGGCISVAVSIVGFGYWGMMVGITHYDVFTTEPVGGMMGSGVIGLTILGVAIAVMSFVYVLGDLYIRFEE